jgi:hypothetical protein
MAVPVGREGEEEESPPAEEGEVGGRASSTLLCGLIQNGYKPSPFLDGLAPSFVVSK